MPSQPFARGRLGRRRTPSSRRFPECASASTIRARAARAPPRQRTSGVLLAARGRSAWRSCARRWRRPRARDVSRRGRGRAARAGRGEAPIGRRGDGADASASAGAAAPLRGAHRVGGAREAWRHGASSARRLHADAPNQGAAPTWRPPGFPSWATTSTAATRRARPRRRAGLRLHAHTVALAHRSRARAFHRGAAAPVAILRA